ncbi:G/T mismatch-specific thymine DNA glycosylase [Gryllus bimaculatus]|nr:G/T mismatch-specific thymine DNA glycosylase [Gryllus bimaculatus]
MQVATLFRETATLLGASMETQEASGVDPQAFKLCLLTSAFEQETLICSRSAFLDGAMKLEPHDDGYETSGDLELRTQRDNQKCLSHIQNAGGHNLKCEPPEDPYSFVDDDPTPTPQPRAPPVIMQPVPKKRGRKKKNILEGGLENTENLINGDTLVKKKLKEEKFMPMFKERKKHDRFNGMPEEEVSKRTLPDHLALNLDIVILHLFSDIRDLLMGVLEWCHLTEPLLGCMTPATHEHCHCLRVPPCPPYDLCAQSVNGVEIGINPGLFAAYKGHHYAGPGNHFWKCLYLSGLTPEPMTADDDYKLLQVGIGFTNMVARATKGSADLTRKEIKEGSQILLEKLQKFKPKIAVFNGKLIFEVFSGKKDFSFGRQPDFVDGTNTYMWVMPSSSARCAQLPRAADKVPFYAALKKFRDYLNGMITDLDETEVVFSDSKLKNYFEPELKEEPKEEHPFITYGRLPNNGELTDLSNAVTKKEDQPPAKKKRGRPKKIKTDSVEPKKIGPDTPKKEHDSNCGEMPKKKRGRPKKIKSEDVLVPNTGIADHTNSSAGLSNCFSPPIQSPTNFTQQNFSSSYPNQPHPYSQNPSQSPSEPHNYHHSPVPQPQHYSQSPQPTSQPFTHSDLSSEISAAISSEHNLGSPSPTSPSLGPPDFEPPSSMPEDTAEDHQNTSRLTKDEVNPGDNTQNPNECRFSSPTPSGDAPNLTYQNFSNFQPNSEPHNVMGYSHGTTPDYNTKRNLAQDVSSKSLSGLESLVDQIPSIAEGDAAHNAVVGSSSGEEQFESSHAPASQFSDDGAYMSGYSNSQQYSGSNSNNSSNYSPHFTSASTNYSVSTSNSYNLHHSSASMNFSVTSLANSSTSGAEIGGQVSSSFSVSSLASNYTSMNPGLMGAAHPMASHMVSSTNSMGGGMFGSGMSGGIMDRACGMGSSMGSLGAPVGLPNPMSSSLPYPYSQYSHGAASYPGPAGGSFQYTPTHNLHVPSPNYPYPSPYSASSYPQASYLPNHVLDRIKQDRMDIGFGGF